MHRVTALVLVSVVLFGAGCRQDSDGGTATRGTTGGSPTSGAAGAGGEAPPGWQVQRDRDFTIAVPRDWSYRRETSASGNEFVTLVAPEEIGGYPRSVVIGRTVDVPERDVGRIIDLFRNVQGDRTFGAQREVGVDGAEKAVLLESTRSQGGEAVPVRAWNVFALSPSGVSLNVELVAPEEIFDTELFDRILRTLEVLERKPATS